MCVVSATNLCTISASPVTVPPHISQESLIRSHSPITKSISKTSIDKLNDARYDTKAGMNRVKRFC